MYEGSGVIPASKHQRTSVLLAEQELLSAVSLGQREQSNPLSPPKLCPVKQGAACALLPLLRKPEVVPHAKPVPDHSGC